jgi:hypothetical protein
MEYEEGANKMIVQKARGMLADPGLSKKFWTGVANIT